MNDQNVATDAPAAEQGKTVNVTAIFRLSDAGQRDAVLRGKPAEAERFHRKQRRTRTVATTPATSSSARGT